MKKYIKLLITTMTLITAITSAAQSRLLLDLKEKSPEAKWKVVNDNVMGGKSTGGLKITDGVLMFKGRTNTDGGGFSSIRTIPKKLETGQSTGVEFKCKGDGRTYLMEFRTGMKIGVMEISYRCEFKTKKGQWIDVKIPFKNFIPTIFGEPIGSKMKWMKGSKARRMGLNKKIDPDDYILTPEKINSLGFIIYDKKDGNFTLDVKMIATSGSK